MTMPKEYVGEPGGHMQVHPWGHRLLVAYITVMSLVGAWGWLKLSAVVDNVDSTCEQRKTARAAINLVLSDDPDTSPAEQQIIDDYLPIINC